MIEKTLFRSTLALGSLALTAGNDLYAQQAVQSLDGARQRVTARQSKEKDAPGGDNFQLGGLKIDVGGSLAWTYNDNIDFAETTGQSDHIVRPGITLSGSMPLTERNSLNLSLDVGYNAYLDNSALNFLDIRAGNSSEIAVDFFIGEDWTVTIFDRPSLSQDAIDSPQISGVADFGRFENTVGIVGFKELANFDLTLGYEHYNYWALPTAQRNLDRQSEIGYVSVGLTPSDAWRWSLNASGSIDNFRQNNLNDAVQFSIGPAVKWQVSEFISADAAVGYTRRDSESGGTVGDLEDASAPFAMFGLNHRVNERLSHRFTFTESITPGTASNFIQTTALNETISLALSEKLNVNVPLGVQFGEESGGGQDFNRYQVGVNFGYKLGQKATARFSYDWLKKDAKNVVGLDYTQNRVMFSLNYDF